MQSKNFLKSSLTATLYSILSFSLILLQFAGFAQADIEVKGSISNESGEPLEGASIQIKGTKKGVTSGAAGNYVIQAQKGDVIIFSFLGYEAQEVKIDRQTSLNIVLHKATSSLEDVVVVGYGTQKRATITGSISVVDGKTLQSLPVTSLSNSLSGRLPGLTALNSSGEPGGDGALLRIRGSNTLGNNSPLIILDGIELTNSFDHLDQSDIESITVLKDASSAIYGARAANGVILITTKRGKSGKPTIEFTHNEGFVRPTVVPKMVDAATYAQLMNEIDMYRNRTPRYSEEDIQKYRDGSDPWKYPNTNWYKAIYKPFASQRYDNLLLTGGSEGIKYFVSAGYKYHDAIYKNSATNYSQFNFRSNLDGQVTKNIKLKVDISGVQENNNYPLIGASNIFFSVLRQFPNLPAYWPNGLPGPDVEYGLQPVLIVTDVGGYNKHRAFNIQVNAGVEIKVTMISGLTFNGNIGLFKRFYNFKQWKKPWYVYTWDYQTYDSNNEPLLVKTQKGAADPSLSMSNINNQNTTLNFLVNYEKPWRNHYLKLLGGVERFTSDMASFNAFRRYFVSTAIDQLFAGGDLDKDNTGTASQTARLNYFGRINYNYQQKYLIEFVWRYDGSYIFPAEKRFGFFPGISAGWKISDENFWKNNVSIINDLKLRASWGKTGNDLITPYQYLASYSLSNRTYVFNTTVEAKLLSELRIPNPNVTWEVAQQTNIGFDGHMLNNKFFFSFDYFRNLRSNILIQRNASVPSSTGLTLPAENIGKVSNRGFEFEFGFTDRYNDLALQFSLNGGFTKNRIEFWDESPGVSDYQKSTGHPMGSMLLYNAIGIFRDQAAVDKYPHWPGARPGDIIFEDVNNDGQINGLDQVRIFKNNIPTFTGGLSIGVTYKNFYMNALLQYATGAMQIHYVPSGDGWANYLEEDIDGRWTPDNIDAKKPRT